MIYVEASLKIRPGRQREFNDFLKNELIPSGDRHGMKLAIAWANLTGLQDAVTDLWEYEDLVHYHRVQQAWADDPAGRDIYRKLQTLILWESTRILAPTRYHPAGALEERSAKTSLLMTARFKVEAGQMGALVRLIRDEFLPLVEARGMRLIAGLQTQVGPLSEVLDIWRFDDVAAYGDVMRSLAGNPEFRRLFAQARVLAPDEVVNLHVPLPYSPYR